MTTMPREKKMDDDWWKGSPFRISCRVCKAEAGNPCVNSKGNPTNVHPERFDDAASND